MDKTPNRIFRFKELILSLVLFITLTSYGVSGQNKYTDKANMDITKSMNQIRPFRMKKPNLLWSYGRKQKLLSLQSQTELFKELQNFDKLESKLKKLKAENLDQDGAVEEKSLYTFKRIVERYALGDHLIEDPGQAKIVEQTKTGNKIYFEDSKLQEMWKEALYSGFSDEDLDLLKEEFSHQQMKINEFAMMHNEDFDLHDGDRETEGEIDAKKRDKLDVKMGFARLEQIAANLVSDDGEFADARLNSLWNTAKNVNWSTKKLASFKEELHHFEKRLNKQKIYAENLQQSFQFSHHRHEPEKHEFLEKKSNMLNQEIKKYHNGLKDRLSKAIRHNEL